MHLNDNCTQMMCSHHRVKKCRRLLGSRTSRRPATPKAAPTNAHFIKMLSFVSSFHFLLFPFQFQRHTSQFLQDLESTPQEAHSGLLCTRCKQHHLVVQPLLLPVESCWGQARDPGSRWQPPTTQEHISMTGRSHITGPGEVFQST